MIIAAVLYRTRMPFCRPPTKQDSHLIVVGRVSCMYFVWTSGGHHPAVRRRRDIGESSGVGRFSIQPPLFAVGQLRCPISARISVAAVAGAGQE